MKILVPNYSFNAAAKTVTFTDYTPVVLESVLLITNVTDNIIIYNFAQAGKGGTAATNVLTLDYDTTGMDNADDIQIFYDDGVTPASNTNLADIKTKLDTLIASTDTLEANTDGVEGLLTSIRDYVDTAETKLQAIADNTDGLEGFTDGIETLLTAIRDYVDTLETKLADVSTATNQNAANALLTSIRDYVDTVETKLSDVATATNQTSEITQLTAIAGKDFATQATLSALNAKVTAVNTGAVVLAAGTAEVGNVKNSGTFAVQATIAAGSSVIGHVITDTGSTTAVTGTVAVSAASLPLPALASTSTKQPALGTAGTASADVITVQGIASMTALKTDSSATTQPVSGTVTANAGTNLNTSLLALEAGGNLATVATLPVAQASTTSGQNGVLVQGSVTTGVPTYTTGQTAPLNLTVSGGLRSTLQASAAIIGKVGIDQTTPGTTNLVALAANQSVNVAQINGVTALMGNGVTGTGSQRVTVASDNTPFAVKTDQTTHGTTDLVAADITKVAGGTAITGGVTGSIATGGNVAHDGVSSGNPDYAGAEAIAHGTNPTAVAAADRTKLYANRAGIPFVMGGHPNDITIEAAYTAAQTNAAIVTVAGGLKIVVTQIAAIVANSTTVDVGVRVGFAAATTPTTTGVVLTHPGIAAGSGFPRGSGSGMLGVGADGEDLRITSDVPTTGSLRVLVTYYTIES